MLNKLERQAADVLKTKSLLRSEQELRQKLDKLDPASVAMLNETFSVNWSEKARLKYIPKISIIKMSSKIRKQGF